MLVNWLYFEYEIVEFGDISFLTGKNSAGKSTLIDALQVVLFGETDGTSFNKAANKKSDRTLKKYLLGSVGEDVEKGVKSLREGMDFTSYIICEFFDTINSERFCLGAVFDSFADGSPFNRKFFILKNGFYENDYIQNNIPKNIKELQLYFKEKYPKMYVFKDTNKEYKNTIIAKYNVHDLKMFRMLKKAVSFDPINNIEKFITENICDINNDINIVEMQENIRNYDEQKKIADEFEKKYEMLYEINKEYDEYVELKKNDYIQRFICDKAQEKIKEEKLIQIEMFLKEKQNEQEHLNKDFEDIKIILENKRKELEAVKREKYDYAPKKENDRLNKFKNDLNDRLYEKKILIENTILSFRQNIMKLNSSIDAVFKNLENIEIDNEKLLKTNKNELLFKTEHLKNMLLPFENIKDDDFVKYDITYFHEVYNELIEIKNEFRENYTIFKAEYDVLTNELKKVDNILKELRKGRKSYDNELMILKKHIEKELKKKYSKDINVNILADLINIKDKKWSNVIEGYLNTQKFYIIVEPEYFMDSYYIYKKIRDEKKIYKYKIVDSQKIIKNNIIINENSLAAIVTSNNKYAKAYINYLLGQVIMCENDEDIRKFSTSITINGMLYKGYTVGPIDPKNWNIHYIGQNAVKQQIEINEKKKVDLTERKKIFEPLLNELEKFDNNQSFYSNTFITDNLTVCMNNVKEKHNLIEKINSVEREILLLIPQLEKLTAFDNQIKEIGNIIKNYEEEQAEILKDMGSCKTKIESKKNEIEEIREEIKELNNKIKNDYNDNNSNVIGEEKLSKKYNEIKDYKKLCSLIFKENKNTIDKKTKKRDKLLKIKTDYNNITDISMPIDDTNEAFYDEFNKIKDIALPEYREKMNEAKKKSQEQFQVEFLDKLRANIESAYLQVAEINKALKFVKFGEDKYEFKVMPSKEYKQYYKMIMSDLRTKDYTLSSIDFEEQFGEIKQDLFNKIIDIKGEYNEERFKVVQQNIDIYTDYRTYIDFDLFVENSNGRQSLSQNLNNKSGGETQTPFYITMVATFAQLYRVNDYSVNGNTARFIIFDEAFNNMDTERIIESINLLRKLNLQVIICAPTIKAADIMPMADKTLFVYRENSNIRVIPWTREMGEIEPQEEDYADNYQ